MMRDYQLYTNEGFEVEHSGNYSVIGWLGDEHVVVDNLTSKWIISKLIFEQNSTDTKTLHIGKTWDLGDGYSLKLVECSHSGDAVILAFNNSNGILSEDIIQNQSTYIFTADLGAPDESPIFVTYLNEVNLTYIELKYTWLASQDTTAIHNGESFGVFETKSVTTNAIRLVNEENVLLTRDSIVPLADNLMFEVEDTPTVRYRLIHQAEIAVEGDISYNSSIRKVTFDPFFNLNENTDYFPLITTGAEDLAGNGLTEDYIWTFSTVNATLPTIIIDPVTSPTNLYYQTVTGTMESGATVEVTCSTATVGTVNNLTDTTWSVEIINLSEGMNVVNAVATDNAGNQNTAIATIYLTSSSTLYIGSANALPNSTITIQISVANVTNISRISFDLLYNSSVVIVSSVSASESFTGSSITQNMRLFIIFRS